MASISLLRLRQAAQPCSDVYDSGNATRQRNHHWKVVAGGRGGHYRAPAMGFDKYSFRCRTAGQTQPRHRGTPQSVYQRERRTIGDENCVNQKRAHTRSHFSVPERSLRCFCEFEQDRLCLVCHVVNNFRHSHNPKVGG